MLMKFYFGSNRHCLGFSVMFTLLFFFFSISCFMNYDHAISIMLAAKIDLFLFGAFQNTKFILHVSRIHSCLVCTTICVSMNTTNFTPFLHSLTTILLFEWKKKLHDHEHWQLLNLYGYINFRDVWF